MNIKRKIGYYSWFGTSLGPVLMAATSKGLCKLGWETNRSGSLRWLRTRFPRIQWVEKKSPLASQAKSVEFFLKGRVKKFQPPLDLPGTQFQREIWNALRRVPAGRTITYKKLASIAGHPRAIRAVANACARNSIAVAIPCHRVVHTDSSPTGYRWGIKRKQFLLKLEGAME